MPPFTFIAHMLFIFLAIVGGIIGVILEGAASPPGTVTHNPATHDTVFPIVGWAILFALYLAIAYVGAQNLTAGFKAQRGTFAVLPFFYRMLANRLADLALGPAHPRANEGPPARDLACDSGLERAALSDPASPRFCRPALEYWFSGFSPSFVLLAGTAVLLRLIRKPAGA